MVVNLVIKSGFSKKHDSGKLSSEFVLVIDDLGKCLGCYNNLYDLVNSLKNLDYIKDEYRQQLGYYSNYNVSAWYICDLIRRWINGRFNNRSDCRKLAKNITLKGKYYIIFLTGIEGHLVYNYFTGK